MEIEESGEGIIGIVTDNSFLDGLIHRQMRRNLFDTFHEIYIVNLHGSAQKREDDKNIFDIMIGGCVVFFVKYKAPAAKKRVMYFSTLENNILSRKEKLAFLDNTAFEDIRWTELNPAETKNYWFVKKDFAEADTYGRFIKITDIFNKYSSGLECRRDSFCVKYSLSELNDIKEELSNNYIETIRSKYNVTDSDNWDLATAMNDLTANYNPITLYYRPFDYRYTSLSRLSHHFLGHPFYEIMRHFENKVNIGISFVRQFSDAKPYTGVLVSQYPIEKRANYSFQEGAFIAPLYLYNENFDGEHPCEISKTPNYTRTFQEKYLSKLDWQPLPEEVLAYIYVVLHSPVYRKKYFEFLKTDFSAVPITIDKQISACMPVWDRNWLICIC
jgi:predicted helicase